MTEHYFSKNPSSELKIKKISQVISGKNFQFYTASGIFSKERVDRGTLVLAESMQIEEGNSVLDIGCGIGVLAIAAAKIHGAKVTLTDINERAIMLAKKNLGLNKVEGEVLNGNLYDKVMGKFDVILSNPPQNAGRQICFDIISQSKKFLKESGTLQVVARPNKGGKVLAGKMQETFGNVQEIERKSGYSVYLSVN